MSDSLWPHESQHARAPCPSPAPGVHSNSCPLSWWCHPAISSSVIPFFSCPQSFPASGSFPMSPVLRIRWPKYWSFSVSISSSNEYSGLISCGTDWLDLLAVPWDCQESSPTPQFKSIHSLALSFLYHGNFQICNKVKKWISAHLPSLQHCTGLILLHRHPFIHPFIHPPIHLILMHFKNK